MIGKKNFIKCKDINGVEFEVSVESLSFRPSVYGIIFKDEKVLLSKQWDGYDFPGGGIKIGETIESALKREVKEETGFDVKMNELIACENSFFKYRSKDKYVQSILIYYLCEITGGEICLDFIAESEKEYIGEPEWISLKDIEKIKFYNSIDSSDVVRKALETYNNKNKEYGRKN